jgi:hypothetical protein
MYRFRLLDSLQPIKPITIKACITAISTSQLPEYTEADMTAISTFEGFDTGFDTFDMHFYITLSLAPKQQLRRGIKCRQPGCVHIHITLSLAPKLQLHRGIKCRFIHYTLSLQRRIDGQWRRFIHATPSLQRRIDGQWRRFIHATPSLRRGIDGK